MQYSAMEQYWIWLSSIEGIGPKRFYQLLTEFEDARAVWDDIENPLIEKIAGAKAYRNMREACDTHSFFTLFDTLEKKGIRAITRLSEEYPIRLSRVTDAPPTIYVIGSADLNAKKMFSIVGSRRCTRDGQRAAYEFAKGLSDNGVTVVSGMALGIDARAHAGALKGSSPTVAVLGSGADVIYPMDNKDIYDAIVGGGGSIVSEYLPGTQPLPGNFPARNRIISGMSEGVLLVEGAQRSGAMITVNYALEQGKDIFAVPGSIYSILSQSPNKLIVDGASPAISAFDILEHYRWAVRDDAKITTTPNENMSPEEAKIVMPLKKQSLTLSELAIETGFEIKKLNSLLTILELRGLIFRQSGGEYRAN